MRKLVLYTYIKDNTFVSDWAFILYDDRQENFEKLVIELLRDKDNWRVHFVVDIDSNNLWTLTDDEQRPFSRP